MPDAAVASVAGSSGLRAFTAALVTALWLLPGWLVWLVISHPDLQRGLKDWQVGILAWYPLIAILMLYFAVVLYRRLPTTWPGMFAYIISTIGMTGLHWWLSNVNSLTLLIGEGAAFSLTLFVVGFSIELFSRILTMARRGHWVLVVFGGLANLIVFVAPGILIATTLYLMLYQQGLFRGGLLIQIPYLLALSTAVWRDWRSFRAM